jgi:hypothetical protein
VGGGLLLGGALEIRGLVGFHHHGAAALSLQGSDGALEGSQRASLWRFGVVVGPRVPLGRGAHLRIEGGGGLAVASSSTELEGWGRTTDGGIGGFACGGVGVELPVTERFSMGPTVGVLVAGIPQQTALMDVPPLLVVSSGAVRALQLGVRGTLGPRR